MYLYAPALNLLVSVILDLRLLEKPVLETCWIHLAVLLLVATWIANPSSQFQPLLPNYYSLLPSRIHFGLLAVVLAFLHLLWV